MIFLYLFLFIIIFIILSAIGLIGTIARILFGGTRRTTKSSDPNNTENSEKRTKWYTYQHRRKKIFDSSDGEYVEFEEIKEEKKEQ